MKTLADRRFLRRTTTIVVIALGISGSCAFPRQIGIEEVLAALTAADRKIDNYCSLERSFTYDRNGRLKEGASRGVHFYSKPDESVLCVDAPAASYDIYYETGRLVKSRKDGKTSQQTLPDSFFLRDWRSMMRLHQGQTDFPAESDGPLERKGTAPPVKLEFAAGDPRKTAWREDGIYDIQITRPGYERAILRVDVPRGVILEKSVYQLPGGMLTAREVHSEFVPLAGSYLPGKTIYEYGEQTVVIYWSEYRANLPVDFKRINMDQSTCERLEALTAPVRAESVRPHPAAAGAVASPGLHRRNK